MARLEQQLGHRFRDRSLLELSLVHRSYLNEVEGPIESNERLEFLGDAVLGFIVARALYRLFPAAAEGQLTEMRAQLVRWETLAGVAQRLELGALLRMGRGEERSGGRERPLNLARAFEALIGALAEDASVATTERCVLTAMEAEFERLVPRTGAADVKSRLQVLSQARIGLTPVYRVLAVDGPEHSRIYRVAVLVGDRVEGNGSGPNKRAAERAAAAAALRALGDDLTDTVML